MTKDFKNWHCSFRRGKTNSYFLLPTINVETKIFSANHTLRFPEKSRIKGKYVKVTFGIFRYFCGVEFCRQVGFGDSPDNIIKEMGDCLNWSIETK